jgi:hypothetical protein
VRDAAGLAESPSAVAMALVVSVFLYRRFGQH